MKIPIGFEVRDVTEDEIRAAQVRLLRREETDADRSLLDAVLSWFALFLANVISQTRRGEAPELSVVIWLGGLSSSAW